MKKVIAGLIGVALLAPAAPAMAAKGKRYAGKTSSGHEITLTVGNDGIVAKLVAGIRISCIPIQGGGAPFAGAEVFGFRSTEIRARGHSRFSFMDKPAFHYNEVTMNNEVWLKRRGNTMSGRLRRQYSFLVPKYPIGTFTVYSCAGGATFRAKERP